MGKQDKRVAVPGGELAVVDHGGQGPDVLLIHSICHSSPVWHAVAAHLTPEAHVVAVDLRSHGQSNAEATHVDQIPQDLELLIAALDLEGPILVGHDVAGGFAAAVAASHPDVVRGLVVIDSPVTEDQASVRDIVKMVGADTIVDMLTARFGLGRTGTDAESLQAFLADQARQNLVDMLSAAPDERTMRTLMLRSMVVDPDGSWVFRPIPQALRALTKDPDEAQFQPGRELLAELSMPVTVINLTQGRNGSGGEGMTQLAQQRSNLNLVTIDSGPHVLYTHPEAIAAEILKTARTAGETE